jgi:hypothetical protein
MSVKMRMSEFERQMEMAERIMKEDRVVLRALASRPAKAAVISREETADPSTSLRSGRDDDE